jgi:hypothetical protein
MIMAERRMHRNAEALRSLATERIPVSKHSRLALSGMGQRGMLAEWHYQPRRFAWAAHRGAQNVDLLGRDCNLQQCPAGASRRPESLVITAFLIHTRITSYGPCHRTRLLLCAEPAAYLRLLPELPDLQW